MKKTAAVLATIVTCLALGACGEDDKKADDAPADASSSPTSRPLTKAELIAAGDAVCKASNDRQEAASADLDETSTMAELLAFINNTAIPEIEGQLASLRGLQPPPEDAKTIDAMLDSLEKALATVKTDPEAAMTLEEDADLKEANRIGKAYGFKVCSKE